MTEKLDIPLAAGTYAIVFGSGAFGASGTGGLGGGNNTIGSPNYIQYVYWNGDAWTQESFPGVRITVSSVPEPSTWAMIVLGFAGLGLASARMRAPRTLA